MGMRFSCVKSSLNNILLLEPNSFIDRIEKGIFFFYENLYSEKCLSEQKLISTIEKNIELKKIEYSNIATLLRNAWNIYERINKRQLTKDDILTKFSILIFIPEHTLKSNLIPS